MLFGLLAQSDAATQPASTQPAEAVAAATQAATQAATSQPAGPGIEPSGLAAAVERTAESLDKISWLQYEVFGLNVSIGRLLVAFAIILISLIVGKIVRLAIEGYAKRLAAGEQRRLLQLFLRAMAGPAHVVVLGYGLGTALVTILNRLPELRGYGIQIGLAVVYIGLGWFIYNLVDVVEFYLDRAAGRTKTKLDDQLVPLLRKSMRVIIVILVALFIAQNVFNANIAAMLAGLGVGGLAVALAAQDTIANLFGSITIFADRPFGVGDLVKIDAYFGTVEEVGFRSTKIRTLDGHLVSIPNAKVSTSAVENVGKRPSIRRMSNITITYDTPPEKVEKAVAIIEQVLGDSEHIEPDFWVAFNEFNDWSLNLAVKYNVRPPDFVHAIKVHQEVNLKVMRAFAAEGIEFAFPTHTAYHKTEQPLKIEQISPNPSDAAE